MWFFLAGAILGLVAALLVARFGRAGEKLRQTQLALEAMKQVRVSASTTEDAEAIDQAKKTIQKDIQNKVADGGGSIHEAETAISDARAAWLDE